MEEVEQVAPESNAAQDNADFEKGFNGARGIPPVETKPAEVVAEVAEAPKQEEAPDPWKDVSPTIKAEFDSVREKLALVEKLPDQLRNIHGHIGNLNSQLKTALQAKAVTSASGSEAPTQAQIEQAAVSPEEMKELEEDFPVFARVLKGLQKQQPKTETVDVDGITTKVQGAFEDRIAAAEAKAAAAEEFAFVRIKHPGWKQTVATPEFKAWHGSQPPEIQALAGSASGEDAVSMLDKFVEHQKKQQAATAKAEANKQRLNRATTPQGVPVTAASSAPSDEDLFQRGFKKARGT